MPQTVGRYRIDRVIGSGAFATVWLAHDEVHSVPVAVKVLAGGLIDDLDVRRRFLEEASILRRADSERLVRVHDIGELDDGRPYFVMSYADRGTLADRMRGRVLPIDEALRLAAEVARGVEVINRLGVIHRDLKPSNVLFQSAADGGERLLIADLGLAKALAHASGAFTLPVGTPGYMSPEQARLGGGLDVRADVYGLGALTYHLITGKAPGLAPVVVPPSAKRPNLPPGIDAVVMRALESDRERRWPTAEAFASAVGGLDPEATVLDDPERTTPDPATSPVAERTVVDAPAGRPSVRDRLLVVTGLAGVLVIGSGGAYLVGRLADEPPKRADDFVTVSDATGRLSVRVPRAWRPQPQQSTWPIPVADRAQAPALRATPDYARFVRDDVPTPGLFIGLTHDLSVRLPPDSIGTHAGKCTRGPDQPYRHGSLSGDITPWSCGSIMINEVGLRDTTGQFALWVRVKLAGPPDITRTILDSIRTTG
jgi:serine/threonine protein kinase